MLLANSQKILKEKSTSIRVASLLPRMPNIVVWSICLQVCRYFLSRLLGDVYWGTLAGAGDLRPHCVCLVVTRELLPGDEPLSI